MRCVFPIESRDKCPSSSLPAAWRGARAQRGRGGAPRGAAWPPLPRRRTDFTHFRDCGHPTVCRRGGRIRMRRPRRQTASACYPGRTSAARTALHRRHSNASPAWPPPAMPPPAAASSRRRQLPPALQRQRSAAQAPPRPLGSPPRPASATAVSVAMATAAARGAREGLHMCV